MINKNATLISYHKNIISVQKNIEKISRIVGKYDLGVHLFKFFEILCRQRYLSVNMHLSNNLCIYSK